MNWRVENESIGMHIITLDVPKNIGAVGNMLCHFLFVKFE